MEWDQSKHPRHPAGSPSGTGGEFAPKDTPEPGREAGVSEAPTDGAGDNPQTGDPPDPALPPDIPLLPGPGPLPKVETEKLPPLLGDNGPSFDPNPVITEGMTPVPHRGPGTVDQNVIRPNPNIDGRLEIEPPHPNAPSVPRKPQI